MISLLFFSRAFGFRSVKIEPHLGALTKANGEMPHPKGKVAVSYVNTKGKWDVVINLPETISGDFIWNGKHYPL